MTTTEIYDETIPMRTMNEYEVSQYMDRFRKELETMPVPADEPFQLHVNIKVYINSNSSIESPLDGISPPTQSP